MPKIRTHRATAKRLKVTKSGKLKRSKANKSHILSKKTTKRKRDLRKGALVHPSDMPTMKKLLNI